VPCVACMQFPEEADDMKIPEDHVELVEKVTDSVGIDEDSVLIQKYSVGTLRNGYQAWRHNVAIEALKHHYHEQFEHVQIAVYWTGLYCYFNGIGTPTDPWRCSLFEVALSPKAFDVTIQNSCRLHQKKEWITSLYC
jgi:hypothetical protein